MPDTTRKRKRPSYDDQFRTSAVLMLQSQGYPDTPGALVHVARHLKVPAMTLSRWFKGLQNPPPNHLVIEEKQDLRTLYMNEIYAIMKVLPEKRDETSYGTLATAQAIFFDKVRLLDGLPTEIVRGVVEFVEVARRRNLDPLAIMRNLVNEMDAVEAEAERVSVTAEP